MAHAHQQQADIVTRPAPRQFPHTQSRGQLYPWTVMSPGCWVVQLNDLRINTYTQGSRNRSINPANRLLVAIGKAISSI
jgi:hypothetical protein